MHCWLSKVLNLGKGSSVFQDREAYSVLVAGVACAVILVAAVAVTIVLASCVVASGIGIAFVEVSVVG